MTTLPALLPQPCRKPSPDRHVLALEEVRLRGAERGLILGGAAMVLAFLVWAQATALPEIAAAPGEVTTNVAAAPLQHLEGGIVEEVLVQEGAAVTQGQPLLRMHDAAARADLGQLTTRQAVLLLQAQRLQSLVEGLPLLWDGAAAQDPAASLTLAPLPSQGLAAPQNAALESRLAALANRLLTATEQAAQRRSEITMLDRQAAALQQQVTMFQDEFDTRQALARQGLTTRIAALEAQRQLLTGRAEQQRLEGQAATARLALAEAQSRMAEIRSTAHDEARQEAARVAQEIAEIEQTMARLQDRAQRTLLRAPISGVLRGLAVQRTGSVVQPGALLGEIVPQEAALVVEARVTPRDIGFISLGQAVQVKVQSFDYARFGTLEGRVERISAGAFLDEQRQPHYRVRVALLREHLGTDPERTRLIPGMTVQAEITTGQKTVMQYLLKPLYAASSTALRER